MLKKLLPVVLCCILLQPISAQQPFQFMGDGDGKPLFIQSNYIAEGSPYFNDEYLMAQVSDTKGRTFSNVRIKLNLVDHLVQYLNLRGKEMITDAPIKQVKFTQYLFDNGQVGELTLASYGTPINDPHAVVYQVVDTGKVTLLKKTSIDYRDDKQYGSANTTRTFVRKEVYAALLPGGTIRPVEKGKDALVALFSDRQKAVEGFIEESKLKCNSGRDYEKVFRFYNSLQPLKLL